MNDNINEIIYMSKLAEQTERFDDMVYFMKTLLEISPELKDEERNLLSIAYKNSVGQRRTAWRALSAYEMKEKTKATHHLEIIHYYKEKIEKELKEICTDVLSLVEDLIAKSTIGTSGESKSEARIFYLKMKADYNRYVSEIAQGDEQEMAIERADSAYKEAMELAKNTLKTTQPLRIGIALNYSVFCYEILNDVQMAANISQKAFNEAQNDIEKIEDEQYKDTTTVLQLMGDNLKNWNNEINEKDEQENPEK